MKSSMVMPMPAGRIWSWRAGRGFQMSNARITTKHIGMSQTCSCHLSSIPIMPIGKVRYSSQTTCPGSFLKPRSDSATEASGTQRSAMAAHAAICPQTGSSAAVKPQTIRQPRSEPTVPGATGE